jgi:hypothetical protein
MTSADLTPAELVFLNRMLPHFMAGKSVVESAKAVVEDDARLFEAFCDRSHTYYVPVGDGRSASTRVGKGDVIASELTSRVYEALRAA